MHCLQLQLPCESADTEKKESWGNTVKLIYWSSANVNEHRVLFRPLYRRSMTNTKKIRTPPATSTFFSFSISLHPHSSFCSMLSFICHLISFICVPSQFRFPLLPSFLESFFTDLSFATSLDPPSSPSSCCHCRLSYFTSSVSPCQLHHITSHEGVKHGEQLSSCFRSW